MSRYAPTILTHQADIAALEALLPQLKGQTQVEITLDDGSVLHGTVAVQPTVQQYRDADENEGSNGQLRLDDLASPDQQHVLWLDQIRAVRSLPPVE
ncbi:DUF3247 family protein [Paracidovorax citrulli]